MKTPALDLWRRELKAGARTPTTFDALWKAACLEMNAIESQGAPRIAAAYRAEALAVLRAAARVA